MPSPSSLAWYCRPCPSQRCQGLLRCPQDETGKRSPGCFWLNNEHASHAPFLPILPEPLHSTPPTPPVAGGSCSWPCRTRWGLVIAPVTIAAGSAFVGQKARSFQNREAHQQDSTPLAAIPKPHTKAKRNEEGRLQERPSHSRGAGWAAPAPGGLGVGVLVHAHKLCRGLVAAGKGGREGGGRKGGEFEKRRI